MLRDLCVYLHTWISKAGIAVDAYSKIVCKYFGALHLLTSFIFKIYKYYGALHLKLLLAKLFTFPKGAVARAACPHTCPLQQSHSETQFCYPILPNWCNNPVKKQYPIQKISYSIKK
jgi:hypothetical protein